MIGIGVTSEDLAKLARTIKREENGRELRRDLVKNLRVAIRPAAQAAKASIKSMPSRRGLRHNGGSLRAAIARQVVTQVSLTTRSAKVKVRVRKRDMPRGFTNAPKVLSQPRGWRHPTIQRAGATPKWVHQMGKPGWFDKPMQAHRAEYRTAVEKAMQDCADRIARKV